MTRKLLMVLVVAVLTFVSLSASAIHHKVSNNYYHNGYEVYAVKIYNDRGNSVYCKLTADNGAYYDGWIPAYSWTPWMRINDITAHFNWKCRNNRF